MKNKYDFEPILSNEVIKKNRLNHLQKAKDTKWEIATIGGFILVLVATVILIIVDDKASYNRIKAKCNLEDKQIVETYRYDGEKEYICQ